MFSAESAAAHPQVALARGWAAVEAGEAEVAAEWAALVLASPRTAPLADGAPMPGMGLLLRAALSLSGTGQAAADAEAAGAAMAGDYPLRGVALLILGSLALLDRDTEAANDLLIEAERLMVGRVPSGYASGHGSMNRTVSAIFHAKTNPSR